MGIFNFNKSKGVEVVTIDNGYHSFSTPFVNTPKGNLSLPFIYSGYRGKNYVPFGEDNLYRQYLNQMYFTSPLHGSVVDFKVTASVGGGFELETSKLDTKGKVALYGFKQKVNLDKLVPRITQEEVLHDSVYFKVTIKNGLAKNYEHIGSEKVRCNEDKTVYTISKDWSQNLGIYTLLPYKKGCADGCYILAFEELSAGQDIYPIPRYTSALNFAFLSGELSYLSKSNIQNAVFPSFSMMFPKKPQNNEELETIQSTVNKMKGAENAGKAVAFFANNKDQLPTIEAIPVNQNDKLFQEASALNTEQICFAHTIDPILMGVRTTGSLGGGADIKQAYVIFEKNVVLPLRNRIEDIVNSMIELAGVKATLTINNFQIINETIVEIEGDGSSTSDALNAMSPLVATKVLSSMTINETRSLAGLKPIDNGDITQAEQDSARNSTPTI